METTDFQLLDNGSESASERLYRLSANTGRHAEGFSKPVVENGALPKV